MFSFVIAVAVMTPGDELPIASEPIASEPKEAAHAYRWVHGDAIGQVHLYDGKKQIGTWLYSDVARNIVGGYYKYDGKTWTESELPKGAPERPSKPVPETPGGRSGLQSHSSGFDSLRGC